MTHSLDSALLDMQESRLARARKAANACDRASNMAEAFSMRYTLLRNPADLRRATFHARRAARLWHVAADALVLAPSRRIELASPEEIVCNYCDKPLNDRESYSDDEDIHDHCAAERAACHAEDARDAYESEAYDRARDDSATEGTR